MKGPCKAKRPMVWAIISRLATGIMVLTWLAREGVRLLPRAVGGEGVYAWAEWAERAYRATNR